MNLDYLFDFLDSLWGFIDIRDYILLYLSYGSAKIPSLRFWANTALIVRAWGKRLKITFRDGEILTLEDCFKEMEDCLKEKPLKKVK